MSSSSFTSLPIKCNALGKNASFISWIDCVGFQIPFILETIGFGYICWFLLFIIIVISIFGKSIETYQWFILNQAVWDFLFIYDYICEKPTYQAYFQMSWDESYEQKYNQGEATCFYGDSSYFSKFNQFVKLVINFCSFMPLFLLTFSRFLCMYYSNFYKKYFTTFKTILFIIIFEIFVTVILEARYWAQSAGRMARVEGYDNCKAKHCSTNITQEQACKITDDLTACNLKIDRSETILELILGYIQLFLPILLLIFSIIFAIFLAIKVAKQIIFQAKNNPTNLYSSLRITLVILFQCFMTAVVISFTFHNNILNFLGYIRRFSTYNISGTFYYDKNGNFHPPQPPVLPDMIVYLASSPLLHCLYVFRIFIDSILVLIFLSHYRKYCLMVIKFLVWIIKNANLICSNLVESKNVSSITVSAAGNNNNSENRNVLFKKRNN